MPITSLNLRVQHLDGLVVPLPHLQLHVVVSVGPSGWAW